MWLQEFFKSPKNTASISEASVYLSQKIVQVAEIKQTDHVVEIGIGGGAVTKSLRGHGASYIGFDINEQFVKNAQLMFTEMKFVHADARHVGEFLPSPADIVVSSLGLRLIEESVIREIFREFVKNLAPSGRIVQYTYGLKDPVSESIQKELNIKSEPHGWIFKNAPPAQVFSYKKI